MRLLEVLAFVVAIWGIYLTFLRIRFDKQHKIKENLVKSWTGAKPTCGNILNIQGTEYVLFSLEDYKKVMNALKVIRYHFSIYRIVAFFGVFLFLAFLGLMVCTVVITWQTLGLTEKIITDQKAKILIVGHIIIPFLSLWALPFFRYFENLYLKNYYKIDEKGQRVPVSVES